jgi:hypothetical protein
MRVVQRSIAVLAPLLLAACAASDASPSAVATPSPMAATPTLAATPTSSPTSVATPGESAPAAEGVVVTFRVADAEEYRILVTDPADIAIAEQLLAGEEAPRIPNGMIVRDGDGGVNTGYGWHIDPATLEFAEVTTEVCDGRPSYVEDGTLTGEWFCPWSAEVIAIEPAG